MSARDIVVIGVMVFALAIAFFAGHHMINTAIDQMIANPVINASSDTTAALQNTKDLTNRMDYVVGGVFLALTLALIITGYLIGGNPIFMFIYFLFVTISTVLATILSNVWETVASYVGFTGTLAYFPISNHLLTYLPIYMVVIGFIGMVAMFAKPYITGGEA